MDEKGVWGLKKIGTLIDSPVLDRTADRFTEEMDSEAVLVPEVGVAFAV